MRHNMALNRQRIVEQLSLHNIDEPPGATAARQGETDEQVRQRNAREFREWQPAFPVTEDRELNIKMLSRLASGDFSSSDERR